MQSISARAIEYGWIILLVGFGLIGNAYFAFRLYSSGYPWFSLIFCGLFLGSCALSYQTWEHADEFRRFLEEEDSRGDFN